MNDSPVITIARKIERKAETATMGPDTYRQIRSVVSRKIIRSARVWIGDNYRPESATALGEIVRRGVRSVRTLQRDWRGSTGDNAREVEQQFKRAIFDLTEFVVSWDRNETMTSADDDYDGFELTKQKGGWFILECHPHVDEACYFYHVPTRRDAGQLLGLLYERYGGAYAPHFVDEYAGTLSNREWIDRRTQVAELEQRYNTDPVADFKSGSAMHLYATCRGLVDSLTDGNLSEAKGEHKTNRGGRGPEVELRQIKRESKIAELLKYNPKLDCRTIAKDELPTKLQCSPSTVVDGPVWAAHQRMLHCAGSREWSIAIETALDTLRSKIESHPSSI